MKTIILFNKIYISYGRNEWKNYSIKILIIK